MVKSKFSINFQWKELCNWSFLFLPMVIVIGLQFIIWHKFISAGIWPDRLADLSFGSCLIIAGIVLGVHAKMSIEFPVMAFMFLMTYIAGAVVFAGLYFFSALAMGPVLTCHSAFSLVRVVPCFY
jgi:hypothetical protein